MTFRTLNKVLFLPLCLDAATTGTTRASASGGRTRNAGSGRSAVPWRLRHLRRVSAVSSPLDAAELADRNDSSLRKLWMVFVPTCDLDHVRGSQAIANQVFEILNGLRDNPPLHWTAASERLL